MLYGRESCAVQSCAGLPRVFMADNTASGPAFEHIKRWRENLVDFRPFTEYSNHKINFRCQRPTKNTVANCKFAIDTYIIFGQFTNIIFVNFITQVTPCSVFKWTLARILVVAAILSFQFEDSKKI